MPRHPAIVLLSGGQDSTTCLALAKEIPDRAVHAITINYGQRHEAEIQAARTVASILHAASHEVINVPNILIGNSPLVNKASPLEQHTDFATMEVTIGDRVEKSEVPGRNLLFLTIAYNRAMHLGADAIYLGACGDDAANYPDCRQPFFKHLQWVFGDITGEREDRPFVPILELPLLHYTKAEEVDLAWDLPGGALALAYSHTAYDGKFPPVGKDHASLLRAEGFLRAGKPDPLVLRAVLMMEMTLPETPNYEVCHGEFWSSIMAGVDVRSAMSAPEREAAINAALRTVLAHLGAVPVAV